MNKARNTLIIFLIKTLIFLISFPTFSFGTLMIFFGGFFGNPNFGNFIFLLVMGIGPTFLGGYAMLKFVFGNINLPDNLDYNKQSQSISVLEHHSKIEANQKPKTKKEILHDTFYKLLELRGGKVTSLNLAMETAKMGVNINGKEANDFLREKATEFNHSFKLGQNGEVIYDFEYLSMHEIQELERINKNNDFN